MPLTKLNSASVIERLPTGSVIQTNMASSNVRKNSASTSWVDTGLISLTFANNLQANSKVLVRFHTTTGEANLQSNWAAALWLSIFENSTNLGDSSIGLAGQGNTWDNADNSNAVYTSERVSGELLFTPSVNNGTYTLQMRCQTASTKTVGGTNNTHANLAYGNTQVIIQEIKG